VVNWKVTPDHGTISVIISENKNASEGKEIKLNKYKYLTTEQMDEFVSNCGDVVINKLL